ncbi:hypothetical protein EUGRSUZ_B03633 [Eucalyptus grandis]|uniref:Uncharacterized protein n=2 Tax=Eucalyptus grandis TaxID=71139 RepID=A0ACC3LX85_EUCGR|nr:hypothetical protein EUGRSUZ_B03633 [Eucalyptus grandis]
MLDRQPFLCPSFGTSNQKLLRVTVTSALHEEAPVKKKSSAREEKFSAPKLQLQGEEIVFLTIDIYFPWEKKKIYIASK